jgi:hypothetical protein
MRYSGSSLISSSCNATSAGSHGHLCRRDMIGVDVGDEVVHVSAVKPTDQRPRRFGGVSLVLPGEPDDPGDLCGPALVVADERCLHGADRP